MSALASVDLSALATAEHKNIIYHLLIFTTFSEATDENENNLRWNQEDKMRKIWNFSKSPKPQPNDKENYKVVAKPKQLHPMR